MTAPQTFQPKIRTYPQNPKLIASARMIFLHNNNVIYFEILFFVHDKLSLWLAVVTCALVQAHIHFPRRYNKKMPAAADTPLKLRE